MVLEAQQDVYQTQMQRFDDQMHDLVNNQHITHANDSVKDKIAMIIEKNTTAEPCEFYGYT